MSSCDYLFKFVMVGDAGTGKSCLLLRYSDDMFTDSMMHTIGVEFKIRTVVLNGKVIKQQIWDTAGQERFRSITSAYYKGAHAILLCFNDRESFDNIPRWHSEATQSNVSARCMLVGCQSDLDSGVTDEEANALASSLNMTYMNTSAKTGANVAEAFNTITEEVVDALSAKDAPPSGAAAAASESAGKAAATEPETSGKLVREGCPGFEAQKIFKGACRHCKKKKTDHCAKPALSEDTSQDSDESEKEVKEQKVFMMTGLNGVGKSTILYKLRLGEVVTVESTVEIVEYKNIKFVSFSCNVDDGARARHKGHTAGTTGVVFVVDSSDADRMDTVKSELDLLLSEDTVDLCPLLVWNNKQDLPGLSTQEVTERLGLEGLGRTYTVQGCCATSGDGLYEGLDWLSNQFAKGG